MGKQEDTLSAEVERLVGERIEAAVATALDAQADQIAAKVLAKVSGSGQSGGTEGVMEGLALAIATLTDQGTGRKRVAPEVLKARDEARARMEAQIAAVTAEGLRPLYELVHKVFLDEVLVEPTYIDDFHRQRPTQIVWPGVPNVAMKPANDAASRIFTEFAAWVGQVPDAAPARRVTAGGLVIMDGAGRRHNPGPTGAQPSLSDVDAVRADREAMHVGEPGFAGQGLQVMGRGSQRYTEKRILGTIAEPARQQA